MSRYLLDTNILIFSMNAPERLSGIGEKILTNPENEVFVSVVSLIEIAIKVGLSKLELPMPIAELPATLLRNSMAIVDLDAATSLGLASLPLYHRDPFDRLLVVQASRLDATLLTSDQPLTVYAEHVSLRTVR